MIVGGIREWVKIGFLEKLKIKCASAVVGLRVPGLNST
jgi:hypothetical protein